MGTNVGLDIGYSNTKLVYSGGDEGHQESVFPVGVSRLDQFNRQIKGITGGDVDTTIVMVDGVEYAAGIAPGKVLGSSRDITENYIKTTQYKALFHAALLYTNDRQVDRLVTGLPVTHWQNEELKNDIKKMMAGEHQVAKKRTVTVDEVEVIPQPGGAFLDAIHYAESNDDQDTVEALTEGSVIIIDPGFYSTDFVVFEEGELNAELSGTTLLATSRIIDRVAELVSADYGAAPGKSLKSEKIESLIRANSHIVRYAGQKIDIQPYIQKSALEISQAAISEIAGSMRNTVLDTVVVAGGGGAFFEPEARRIFSHCEIIQPSDPVLSIARGYHGWAAR
ncbi:MULTISPECIES: ParM/StbA family protein [Halomonadaceae]|uniref:ParM/StbA family protein n=1 Tax=Halomonas casei TaxID=2742613 RepID=A0ABR9F4F8_9GAMM|nr:MULTISPECIES: ParM/StbA family protein [Halomonas]MBE0401343.1 ParM/StbA family protein [Halomonas casei]WKD30488.1 ParM/StbA family protein [Halomonas sp. KG2]